MFRGMGIVRWDSRLGRPSSLRDTPADREPRPPVTTKEIGVWLPPWIEWGAVMFFEEGLYNESVVITIDHTSARATILKIRFFFFSPYFPHLFTPLYPRCFFSLSF